MVQAMATVGMMCPATGGLVWGQMRGCYLKSRGILVHSLGGLCNVLAWGRVLIKAIYEWVGVTYRESADCVFS